MIERFLSSVPPGRRAVLVQLARYGLAGGLITAAFALAYWLLAEQAGLDPFLANTIAFAVFSVISYVTHGAFSFDGHGSRDNHHVRLLRFMAVNLIGYGANQGWIWLLVKQLGGPNWWPVVPMVFVTPLLTFALHRRFVYA